MSIFIFSLCLFLLTAYIWYKIGKSEPKQKEVFQDDWGIGMKEWNRREKLSKIAKSRKRVNGKFVKE